MSSTRPVLPQEPVIGVSSKPLISGDMSAATITSNPTILKQLTVGCYTYSWAGTAPVGTIEIQISNDYELNPDGTVFNAGTWTTVWFTLNGTTPSQTAPITGASGSGAIEWTSGAFTIRTVYRKTSGIGTLSVIFNGKVA